MSRSWIKVKYRSNIDFFLHSCGHNTLKHNYCYRTQVCYFSNQGGTVCGTYHTRNAVAFRTCMFPLLLGMWSFSYISFMAIPWQLLDSVRTHTSTLDPERTTHRGMGDEVFRGGEPAQVSIFTVDIFTYLTEVDIFTAYHSFHDEAKRSHYQCLPGKFSRLSFVIVISFLVPRLFLLFLMPSSNWTAGLLDRWYFTSQYLHLKPPNMITGTMPIIIVIPRGGDEHIYQ
jgi:hypothetical protein